VKQKKFNKKLSFSKETIADLDNFAKEQIHGGNVAPAPSTLKCSLNTYCDLLTICYNVSRCMTVCGGPYC
jgi:hypothetical protein